MTTISENSKVESQESQTFFDVECGTCSVGCFLVTITSKERFVALCVVNLKTFTFQVCEFQDNASYLFLESVLLTCQLNKCYYAIEGQKHCEEEKIKRVLERCGIAQNFYPLDNINVDHMMSLKPWEFLICAEDKAQQHYLGIRTLQSAQRAACHLVSLLGLLEDASHEGQYTLRVLFPSTFMRLDQATLVALNIFPQIPGQKPSPGNSLFDLLNKCRTSMGTDRLKVWIVQPSLDAQEIRERQSIVTLFVEHFDLRNIIGFEFLRKLPNFDYLGRKLHRTLLKPESSTSFCSLEDVIHLHHGLIDCAGLLGLLKSLQERQQQPCASFQKRFIDPLNHVLDRFKRFHQLVEYTFDPKEREQGRAAIHRHFDPNLKTLLEQRDKCLKAMEQHRCEIQNSLPQLNTKKQSDLQAVKLVECNSFGYLFRVKKKDQSIIQKDKTRFRQVRINKADFQFTTARLTNLCKEYLEANKDLSTLQHELTTKTILATASYWPVIERLADLLGYLDILLGFAELSATSSRRYCCPEVYPMDQEPGVICITNGRHPLLEIQHEIQRFETDQESHHPSLILNSISFNKSITNFHLISGPNMGGKSTYIKQVALICLMAQLGCHVPCDAAQLTVIDSILCRVGASDDEQHGISTFYAEMIETAAILKSATSNSLVLMDELGRGTSTTEGLALAIEITRYIAESINCFTLFATHFQELASLENTVKGVSCFKVDVKLQASNLQFLFHVLPGYADHSYGIHVAEMANMPSSIITRAQNISKTLQRCSEVSMDVGYISSLLQRVREQLNELKTNQMTGPEKAESLKNSLSFFLAQLER